MKPHPNTIHLLDTNSISQTNCENKVMTLLTGQGKHSLLIIRAWCCVLSGLKTHERCHAVTVPT